MTFTRDHKLAAIEHRFYNRDFAAKPEWEPQLGDCYTILRNDLELFQITGVEEVRPDQCGADVDGEGSTCCVPSYHYEYPERTQDGAVDYSRAHCPKHGEVKKVPGFVVTMVQKPEGTECGPLVFEQAGFATHGFGPMRIHVPQWILAKGQEV